MTATLYIDANGKVMFDANGAYLGLPSESEPEPEPEPVGRRRSYASHVRFVLNQSLHGSYGGPRTW